MRSPGMKAHGRSRSSATSCSLPRRKRTRAPRSPAGTARLPRRRRSPPRLRRSTRRRVGWHVRSLRRGRARRAARHRSIAWSHRRGHEIGRNCTTGPAGQVILVPDLHLARGDRPTGAIAAWCACGDSRCTSSRARRRPSQALPWDGCEHLWYRSAATTGAHPQLTFTRCRSGQPASSLVFRSARPFVQVPERDQHLPVHASAPSRNTASLPRPSSPASPEPDRREREAARVPRWSSCGLAPPEPGAREIRSL
jgi:hypothetical protein